MTFILKPYQVEHIYEPILEVIESNLQNPPVNKSYSIASLSTGAGKTTVITRFNFKHALSKGCDIVYSSPNAASLDEVFDTCQNEYPNANVVKASGFTGDCSLPVSTKQQNIILCHPTVLSQNEAAFKKFEDRNLVIFSDEAHKGFMCPSSDDTVEAFGYNISDYAAQWHNCIYNVPHLAWFLISATPLRTTFTGPMFNHIAEFFEKDILCSTQKAVRSINYMSVFTGSCWDNESFALEDEELKKLTAKYNLPIAKPARLIQAANSYDAEWYYRDLDNVAIAISSNKCAKDYNQFVKAQDVFRHVENKKTSTNVLVANKLIGEAVNIRNATKLFSYHERNSVQISDVTQNVEQLLGRMVRWPDVDGCKNWEDVIDLVETKISQSENELEARKDLYLWIDLVFKYDIYMVTSWANRQGVNAFFSKQTYNIEQWEEYQNRLIVEWQYANQNKTRRKYGDAEKTPSAQKGSQAYKNYKDTNRRCEMPGCRCHDQVKAGIYTEEVYFSALDVHHKDGNHQNNDPSNLMTVCKIAHMQLEDDLKKRNLLETIFE